LPYRSKENELGVANTRTRRAPRLRTTTVCDVHARKARWAGVADSETIGRTGRAAEAPGAKAAAAAKRAAAAGGGTRERITAP
jgi:hypothetical protein